MNNNIINISIEDDNVYKKFSKFIKKFINNTKECQEAYLIYEIDSKRYEMYIGNNLKIKEIIE